MLKKQMEENRKNDMQQRSMQTSLIENRSSANDLLYDGKFIDCSIKVNRSPTIQDFCYLLSRLLMYFVVYISLNIFYFNLVRYTYKYIYKLQSVNICMCILPSKSILQTIWTQIRLLP